MDEVDTQILKDLTSFSKNFKLMTKDEEKFYITQYQEAKANILLHGPTSEYNSLKQEALDQLVYRNIRLVLTYVRRFDGGTLTIYDLYVEGILGLIHAIDKFKVSTGNKLSTYATWWIRQAIQRAIQEKGRNIRIPIHIHDLMNKVRKIYGQEATDNFDKAPPSAKELADLCNLDVATVEKLGSYLQPIGSIDEFANDEENLTVAHYLACNEKYQPENQLEKQADREYTISLLEELGETDCKFMKLMYGFADGIDRTPREMAALFQVPLKEILKREKNIIEQLKLIAARTKVNL